MDTTALLKHRIVFLSEEITQETANRVIPELLLLDVKANDSETVISATSVTP